MGRGHIHLTATDVHGDALSLTPNSYQGSDLQIALTDLCTGDYLIIVSDAYGCEKILRQKVAVDCNLIQFHTTSTISPTCLHGHSGSISIHHIDGGLPPHTLLWDNGSTALHRDQLAAGTYALTITDRYGCTQVDNYTVGSELSGLSISETNNSCICAEGSGAIGVNVSGGERPYQYQWTGPNGYTSNSASPQGVLEPGNYFLTATDAMGCVGTFQTSLAVCEEDAFTLSVIIHHPVCSGGNDGALEIQLNGANNPPYQYTAHDYDGNEVANTTFPLITDLAPGIYYINVTDALGCQSGLQYFFYPSPAEFAVDGYVEPTCGSTGRIVLTGFDGLGGTGNSSDYHFAWQACYPCVSTGGDAPVLEGVTPGTYYVEVTNAEGCQVEKGFIVPNTPEVNFDAAITHQCGTDLGQISLTMTSGTPPYRYQWDNGQTGNSIGALVAGTYKVTVSDDNACEKEETFQLEASPELVVDMNTFFDCQSLDHNLIDLEVSGGIPPYSYQWFYYNEDSNNPIELSEDHIYDEVRAYNLERELTYFAVITDNVGCTVESMHKNFAEDSPFQIITDQVLSEINGQKNGAIYLHPDPLPVNQYSYLWSNGETENIIEGLEAGFYTVTVTKNDSPHQLCKAVKTFEVKACTEELNVTAELAAIECDGPNQKGYIAMKIESNQSLNFFWLAPTKNTNDAYPWQNFHEFNQSTYQDGNTYTTLVSDLDRIVSHPELNNTFTLIITNECSWKKVFVEYCPQCSLLDTDFNIKNNCSPEAFLKFKELVPDPDENYTGHYYVSIANSYGQCPPLDMFNENSYYLKLDREGNFVSGNISYPWGGPMTEFQVCVYNDFGCVNDAFVVKMGNECHSYPARHSWLHDHIPPSDMNNQEVYTGCTEFESCSSNSSNSIRDFKYTPSSLSPNPCFQGTIQCPYWSSGEVNCSFSGGASEYKVNIEFGDDQPIYFPNLPNGKCGCFFPEGSTEPAADKPIFVTFSCDITPSGDGGIEPPTTQCIVATDIEDNDPNDCFAPMSCLDETGEYVYTGEWDYVDIIPCSNTDMFGGCRVLPFCKKICAVLSGEVLEDYSCNDNGIQPCWQVRLEHGGDCSPGFNGENPPAQFRSEENHSLAQKLFDQLHVYPNPFTQQISLQYYSAEGGPVKVSIRNLVAKTVFQKIYDLEAGNHQLQINQLEDLSKGLYVITSENSKGYIQSQKIIKL